MRTTLYLFMRFDFHYNRGVLLRRLPAVGKRNKREFRLCRLVVKMGWIYRSNKFVLDCDGLWQVKIPQARTKRRT